MTKNKSHKKKRLRLVPGSGTESDTAILRISTGLDIASSDLYCYIQDSF